MRPPLVLRGAREHNLRGVDLDLSHGQWVSVVGPSGSGKTTLVFDTLVRESERRVLGALSAKARQFYGKLGRAELDALSGLPAAVAVAQSTASGSARSTVGTLSGCLDLLRLLFAREAVDPGGVALSRSHFSFNHPDGACEGCAGVGLEDRVTPELLVADASLSIRAGALRPTLKSGYTVYSQVTVEVMDQICRAHDFDVDTPWRELSEEQRDVIFHGTKALKVPFGKHGIESRMRWEGITARPREEGYYRGLIPVIEETLKRNRNPNILRFVDSVPCSACAGSRLGRPGREARLGERSLPELLALDAVELQAALVQLPSSEVLTALRSALDERLGRMRRLGLGHLSQDRISPTLSGGEAQRLRLAAQLGAALGRQLVALDEPTLGLHPDEQAGMVEVLDELRALGNTLLVVEHDPDMVRHADRIVRLGPGAGVEGGRLLSNEALRPGDDGATLLGEVSAARRAARTPRRTLVLRGATLNNLRDAELRLGLGTFHVLRGASGAGKSSLLFGTLLPALSGEPGGAFSELEGAPPGGVRAVDARPIGRTSRSTPATWSGIFDLVRKRFAATPRAKELGFGSGRFSFNNKEGRCASCEGLGFVRIGLHLLEDLELECSTCAGGRYAASTLDVTLGGKTIAEVLALTVEEATQFFAEDEELAPRCAALAQLGLGYLSLGQSSKSLSRGEGQRVKLATLLGETDARPSFVLLDEPDRGLHPSDVERLLLALDALVDAGHTVVAISHHQQVWAAADALTDLVDGRTQPGVLATPRTSTPLRGERPGVPAPERIELRGVATHNLRGLDVDIPHERLTVVAGVSGSGKSSLAFDTLAAECWRRFSESLPFQVRRFMRRLPAPDLLSARGLGPAMSLRAGQARAGERSTVATQSEVGPLLRLLFSRAGTLDGEPCGLSAAHFSTEQPLGACLACEGRGVVRRADPERLVTHPELPLTDGALGGTRPGRFFSEVDGQYIATLRAALGDEVDLARPWSELSEEVRRVALEGAGERSFAVTWSYRRGARAGEHSFEGPWEGLLALVEREAQRRAGSQRAAEWRAPLVDVDCASCAGAGLRDEIRQVRVGEIGLQALQALPLDEVVPALEAARELVPRPEILEALLPEIRERLDDLDALGLAHLSLDRRSRTLSEGELQRTRLASVLRSGLTGMTFVLDEPASGLHTRDIARLLERLRRLISEGNTVVVVSHRAELLRAADQLLELGPGAGEAGGQLLAAGPPAEVLAGEGPTASALRSLRTRAPGEASPRPNDTKRFRIVGARAHNLRGIDVELPSSGFVAVGGVSGSGKSSLLFDVLHASATAGAPVECAGVRFVDGRAGWPLESFAEIRSSREAGAGQVVLTSLGLMPSLQALYHSASGDPSLKRAAFSFLSPAGRCELCKGSGRQDVAMDFMADLALVCPKCAGARYRASSLGVRWEGLDVAAFLAAPVARLAASLPKGKLATGVAALCDVGLGHLALGRRSSSLSRGEQQRVALAAGLLGAKSPALYVLDEPATGLHEADLVRLVEVFGRLSARGDLIVAAEHRDSLLAAADERWELGPGSGPRGGTLVSPPREVAGSP